MLIVFTMLSAMALCRSKARVIFKAPPPNLPLDKGEESYGALVGIDLTKQPKICIRDTGGCPIHGATAIIATA